MKLNRVVNGWRLLRVLSVRVEPAKFYMGKLPYFDPTTDDKAGGWRGGSSWPSNTTPGPWGLSGVV